jgi:hypothetical protein
MPHAPSAANFFCRRARWRSRESRDTQSGAAQALEVLGCLLRQRVDPAARRLLLRRLLDYLHGHRHVLARRVRQCVCKVFVVYVFWKILRTPPPLAPTLPGARKHGRISPKP